MTGALDNDACFFQRDLASIQCGPGGWQVFHQLNGKADSAGHEVVVELGPEAKVSI
jgi:hypothetical protein